MFRLEAPAPFADAAFAQEDDLLTAPERIHDDRPFFEGNAHGQTIVGWDAFGNRLIGQLPGVSRPLLQATDP
jgi:hypothetical protein